MRVRFAEFTPVDIALIPTSAYGQVTFDVQPRPPTFSVDDKGDPIVTLPPAVRQRGFRVGAIVELPDELANGYIVSGVAEAYTSPRGPVIQTETEQVLS